MKTIIKYRPSINDFTLEDLIKEVFTKHIPNTSLKLTSSECTLSVSDKDYSEYYQKRKIQCYEIIKLVGYLLEEEMIEIMKDPKNSEVKYVFQPFRDVSGSSIIKIKIENKHKKIILKNLSEEFYIGEELKKLVKWRFLSHEAINFIIAIIALIFGAFTDIGSTINDRWIARNINTVIEFAEISDDKSLEGISFNSLKLKYFKED
ncbi:hypothetical protein [Ilyobacter polytropus]|nr:hypothetical protein [Ilyobacter polytropus]